MRILGRIVAGLIMLVAVANVVRQPFHLRRAFAWSFENEASPTTADKLYRPIRGLLMNRGLTRMGYRMEPGANFNARSTEYFLIQYALAPIVLRHNTTEDEWVLMNYSATVNPFPAPDLTAVEEDLGGKLGLYKKTRPPAEAGKPQPPR